MVREYQDACKRSNCIQHGCKLSSPCTRYAELIELMANCQLRAAVKVLNSSISTDCEGPRPRVAKNFPGHVLRDDDRDVRLSQLGVLVLGIPSNSPQWAV